VAQAVSRVSVVIPTWNGRKLLAAALASLREQRFRDYEVLVVDNGSTDGTAAHVRAEHPEAELLELAENHGFAGAVNAGIGRARGEYVALLNNDMEPDPGWLAELVAALDGDPRAGSAASKLRMLREPGVLDGAGDVVTWYGATWRRGHGEPDRGQYDAPGVVASPCAGAALYRRRALEEVGGFDERFFAYLEDADWGLRAQLAGWPCLWVPTAVAYHLGGATSRRMGDLETELIARNTLALVLKSFPAARLVVWSPLLVAYQAWVLGQAVGRGSWRAVLRGWSAAVRGLPATVRARAEVRRRTRAPGALAGVVTGRIVRRG
jgi:GT2 family glycosyltransferase